MSTATAEPTAEEIESNVLKHQKTAGAVELKVRGLSDEEISSKLEKFAGQQTARLNRRKEIRQTILASAKED